MTKHNSWEKRPFMLTKKPKVIEYFKKKRGRNADINQTNENN